MALQGTLDTFALPDVLRLLAATKKTGRLRITGGRGTGQRVGQRRRGRGHRGHPRPPRQRRRRRALRAAPLRGRRLHLRRRGHPRRTGPADGRRDPPGPLRGAAGRVARDRGRRAVDGCVGDPAHARCRSRRSPSTRTAGPRSWRSAPARPSGASATSSAWPSCPISRAVKELAEVGLVDIAAAPPAGALPLSNGTPADRSPARSRPKAEGQALPEPATPTVPPPPARAAGPAAPRPPRCPGRARGVRAARPARHGAASVLRQTGSTAVDDSRPTSTTGRPPPAAWPTATSVTEDDEQELAKQLATLSPRAANAIRAAAEATTDEERDAALDEVDGEDEHAQPGPAPQVPVVGQELTTDPPARASRAAML